MKKPPGLELAHCNVAASAQGRDAIQRSSSSWSLRKEPRAALWEPQYLVLDMSSVWPEGHRSHEGQDHEDPERYVLLPPHDLRTEGGTDKDTSVEEAAKHGTGHTSISMVDDQ